MTTLITGAAGFIGFHVAKELLARGEKVIGIAPVGCAVVAYDYWDFDCSEAAHGRALAVATKLSCDHGASFKPVEGGRGRHSALR